MNVLMRTATSVALAFFFVGAPLLASAQSMSDIDAQIRSLRTQVGHLKARVGQLHLSADPAVHDPQCPKLGRHLKLGTRGEDVQDLQAFLAGRGYFSGSITGYFGTYTQDALRQWQIAIGLVSSGDSSSNGWGTAGVRTIDAIKGWCKQQQGDRRGGDAITITSLSPASAAVGDAVSISGFGFTSHNTILMDGNVAATNVSTTSAVAIACTTDPDCIGGIRQGLVFTVPSSLGPNCPAGSMCPLYMRLVTPDAYRIAVQNENGMSSARPFVVVATTTSSPSTCGQIKCLSYDPVCGTDGTTYGCGEADALSCNTRVAYKGVCRVPKPTAGCAERPACLDATPRCLIAEPASGWCPAMRIYQ